MNLESIKGNFSNYIDYLNEEDKSKRKEDHSDSNIFATNEQINNEYGHISAEGLKDLVIEDGKITSKSKLNDLENVFPEAKDEDKDAVQQMANELINNKNFIKTFDKDNDERISTEELQAFINAVDEMDGTKGNLSFADVINGFMQLATNNIFSDKVKETQEALDKEKANNKQEKIEQKIDTTSTANQINIGRSSNLSNSNGTSATSAVDGNINEKNLDQLGTEELKNELTTASNTLEEKQAELAKIQNGENDVLKGLEKNIEQAYQNYQEQVKLVDEELAEKVDDTKNKIGAKDNEISQNNSAISMQKSSVISAESQYESAKNHTATLKNKLNSLTGKLGNIVGKIKAKIESMISSLKNKITRAEANEKRKKSNLEKAENKLSDLQDRDTSLKNDKTKLENQLTAYQEEIQAKKPQIAQYFQDYQNARENYSKQKAAMINEAQKVVENAQTYVNKINTAIQVKETSEQIKETTMQQYDDDTGNKILNTVMANIEGTDGNCLQNVTQTIEKVCNSKKKLGTNVTDIAKRLSGQEKGYEDISNNFEEVNIDRSELANLPAGCVVVWENGVPEPAQGHTAITDGKGGEYSNGHQNSMNYVDSAVDYRVFIPTGTEA